MTGIHLRRRRVLFGSAVEAARERRGVGAHPISIASTMPLRAHMSPIGWRQKRERAYSPQRSVHTKSCAQGAPGYEPSAGHAIAPRSELACWALASHVGTWSSQRSLASHVS